MNRGALTGLPELGRSAMRTWGLRGGGRRLRYELVRRGGRLARHEERWVQELAGRRPGFRPARPVVVALGHHEPGWAPAPIRLYGAVPAGAGWPPAWDVHPLTGHRYPAAHWSTLSDADSRSGDIKDVWELGRLTWLGPAMVAAPSSDDAARSCWSVIDAFGRANPPYVGPQWMCGQESSLRGIVVLAVASALRDHPATTDEHVAAAARLVALTVGRVRPTIGYALSQRNNHAVSEAAFLWSAGVLLTDLPDQDRVLAAGSGALEEAIADQWYADGSYAQHSPTYHRLALHALLWVSAVARATAQGPPAGVDDAIARSSAFLASLVEPSTGAVPNLGGNDGALLFDFTDRPIGDFRPVLVHAARAIGAADPVEPGPWQVEAELFGLASSGRGALPARPHTIHTHVHAGGRSRLVLRGGPLRHRPAHADQLHADVWIGGTNVASDPGTYRYTGAPPWSNALAGEEVHNLPRLPGHPQARRRGRFFWSSWVDARVVARIRGVDVDATLLELVLGDARIRRLAVRRGDRHDVIDHSSDPAAVVRWNLPRDAVIDATDGLTTGRGDGWSARFVHGRGATLLAPVESDPVSGWRSPTYGVLEPVRAIVLAVDASGKAAASFAPDGDTAALLPWEALDADSDDALATVIAASG